MKSVAIVVGGGDAPGVNAALEAATLSLDAQGLETWGVRGGVAGLLAGNLERLWPKTLVGIGERGGVFLGTSRERVLTEPDARARLQNVWHRCELDGLILLGGDGTIRQVAAQLVDWGIPLVAIPCTIDNDVPQTERTLGFDSACNHALPIIAAIRDTATALPGRLFIVETLGGSTGHLALAIAYAVQADAVCVPEIPWDLQEIGKRMAVALDNRGYGLCVVSEGIDQIPQFCASLAEVAGHRARLTTVGHAQRGGSPSYVDRQMARDWGEMAVREIMIGRSGVMVAWQAGKAACVPITSVVQTRPKEINHLLYEQINQSSKE